MKAGNPRENQTPLLQDVAGMCVRSWCQVAEVEKKLRNSVSLCLHKTISSAVRSSAKRWFSIMWIMSSILMSRHRRNAQRSPSHTSQIKADLSIPSFWVPISPATSINLPAGLHITVVDCILDIALTWICPLIYFCFQGLYIYVRISLLQIKLITLNEFYISVVGSLLI